MMIEVTAEKLRAMSLEDLKVFAQQLGINLNGLEDRESAIRTRLVQNAVEIEQEQ